MRKDNSIAISILTAFFIASGLFVSTDEAHSTPLLYSINTSSDELVRIDADSETVTVVGPLGYDVLRDIDLASYDGRLFGLNTVYQNYVDLLEIDPLTGLVINASRVSHQGAPIPHAEGLTAIGNQLIISFNSVGIPSSSNTLGSLSSDGIIDNDKLVNQDLDGMATHGNGQIYWVDVEPTYSEKTYIYRSYRQDLNATLIGSYPLSLVGVNDIEIISETIYGIDHYNNMFHIFGDRSFSLNEYGESFHGITKISDHSPVPEPATLLLFGMGTICLTRQKFRRRLKRLRF